MNLQGIIREHSPAIQGRARAGVLHLGDGPVPLVIDTGFTGAFAIPEAVARLLNLEFAGFDALTLATGQETELAVFVGTVVLGGHRAKTWFILGEGPVGMEFLEEICPDLLLDFQKRAVRLRLKKRGKG